ncbi:MAG: RING finger protein [Planctomycetia bacterium]|nr:RING finger protein [Planctomycetia bacterium]
MKNIKCPHCGKLTSFVDLEPGQELPCHFCSRVMVKVPDGILESPTCPVCGNSITDDSTILFCPECGKEYHADCWETNMGCATEGCGYKDALKPMEIPTVVVEKPQTRPLPKLNMNVPQVPPEPEPEPEEEAEPENLWTPQNMPILLKNYAIMAFGGAMVGLVVYGSLFLILFILSIITGMYFWKLLMILSMLAGAAGGGWFAHWKMRELLEK